MVRWWCMTFFFTRRVAQTKDGCKGDRHSNRKVTGLGIRGRGEEGHAVVESNLRKYGGSGFSSRVLGVVHSSGSSSVGPGGE